MALMWCHYNNRQFPGEHYLQYLQPHLPGPMHCLWLHISRFYCTMLFGTMSVNIMFSDWFFTCPATSADICFHVTVTLPHSQAAINTNSSCWPWQEIIGSVGYVWTKTIIVSLCCMFIANAVSDSQMWPKYDWFLLAWVGYFLWVHSGKCHKTKSWFYFKIWKNSHLGNVINDHKWCHRASWHLKILASLTVCSTACPG